jgi:hypothetical protein
VLVSRLEPELNALVRGLIYALSVWRSGASYGQRLHNLSYEWGSVMCNFVLLFCVGKQLVLMITIQPVSPTTVGQLFCHAMTIISASNVTTHPLYCLFCERYWENTPCSTPVVPFAHPFVDAFVDPVAYPLVHLFVAKLRVMQQASTGRCLRCLAFISRSVHGLYALPSLLKGPSKTVGPAPGAAVKGEESCQLYADLMKATSKTAGLRPESQCQRRGKLPTLC